MPSGQRERQPRRSAHITDVQVRLRVRAYVRPSGRIPEQHEVLILPFHDEQAPVCGQELHGSRPDVVIRLVEDDMGGSHEIEEGPMSLERAVGVLVEQRGPQRAHPVGPCFVDHGLVAVHRTEEVKVAGRNPVYLRPRLIASERAVHGFQIRQRLVGNVALLRRPLIRPVIEEHQQREDGDDLRDLRAPTLPRQYVGHEKAGQHGDGEDFGKVIEREGRPYCTESGQPCDDGERREEEERHQHAGRNDPPPKGRELSPREQDEEGHRGGQPREHEQTTRGGYAGQHEQCVQRRPQCVANPILDHIANRFDRV